MPFLSAGPLPGGVREFARDFEFGKLLTTDICARFYLTGGAPVNRVPEAMWRAVR
jgi:hypothetical protein